MGGEASEENHSPARAPGSPGPAARMAPQGRGKQTRAVRALGGWVPPRGRVTVTEGPKPQGLGRPWRDTPPGASAVEGGPALPPWQRVRSPPPSERGGDEAAADELCRAQPQGAPLCSPRGGAEGLGRSRPTGGGSGGAGAGARLTPAVPASLRSAPGNWGRERNGRGHAAGLRGGVLHPERPRPAA